MEIMIVEAFIWEENARWLSQTNCPSYNNGNVICDMSIPFFHLLYLSSILSNLLPCVASSFHYRFCDVWQHLAVGRGYILATI
jgi:hypothetical protein